VVVSGEKANRSGMGTVLLFIELFYQANASVFHVGNWTGFLSFH
jgi:hypothetical protein